jgi:site-specific recombinase XerD
MEKRQVVVQNKSDKPDNVIKRENDILSACDDIQKELPRWMRGYFMYLHSAVLPMTQLSYLRELRFFCRYLITETELCEKREKISDLKPEDFEEIKGVDVNIFLDYCRRYTVEKERSDYVYQNGNAALSHKKSAVSVFFKYLYRDGLVSKNITDSFDPIRMPKPGEREIKALQDDEVMKMLDAADTGNGLTEREKKFWEKTRYRDKLILLLLVTYGLRLSELQQLNVSSFNLSRGEFKIYRKRGKESIMPLNNTISQALGDYISMERTPSDTLSGDSAEALLLSGRNTRLTERQIRQIVKKYTSIGMQTSRRQGYSPHKLRATAATSLIARGNSIYDVQELMDHDNVTTTQLYAAHKLNTKRDLIRDFEWNEEFDGREKEK